MNFLIFIPRCTFYESVTKDIFLRLRVGNKGAARYRSLKSNSQSLCGVTVENIELEQRGVQVIREQLSLFIQENIEIIK